jgi:hypothetical protein
MPLGILDSRPNIAAQSNFRVGRHPSGMYNFRQVP